MLEIKNEEYDSHQGR